MRFETKAQIAKGTLSLLTLVSSLFLLGVLVLVLCVGLQINPFKETTTSFLGAAFGGLIGVAAVLVLLNVATNISLIADAKIAELHVEPKHGRLRNWFIAFLITAAVLVAIVFVGSYFSKERYLAIIRTQADEVLQTNNSLLEETSRLLASGNPEDYRRIGEIRSFLQNQRSGLPKLTIIYSGKFEGKTAIYSIPEYFPSNSQNNDRFNPTYFQCTRNLDCEYLKRFFAGEKSDVLQKYTVRDEQFYIYIPYSDTQSRFVLLFDHRNSYGKLGS